MEQPYHAVLREIQELKAMLAIVIGTADRVGEELFSREALAEAANLFKKMSIDRGEWVDEEELPKYLGPCPYNVGTFIRKEFAFTSWAEKGHKYPKSQFHLFT